MPTAHLICLFRKNFLLVFICLLSSCQQEKPAPKGNTTLFSANVMTIDYRIIIGQTLSKNQIQTVENIIRTTFSEINDTYNKWNPNSEISRLNRLKADVIVPISPELEQFLTEINKIVEISRQRFDPTIEPLQQLWKKELMKNQIPTQQQIDELLPAIGWDKIHFGGSCKTPSEKGKFYKDHDLTQLDLGGIAKGLCVDLLVERLNDAGYLNVFVEWGGEIRASGQHPDQRPWNIFISNFGDTNPENAIAHINLNNQAIATSGDYLQNWTFEENGKQISYFHILNPQTGYLLQSTPTSVASASILAPNCVLADGLATVALTFPSVEEAAAWLEEIKKEYPTMEYWLKNCAKINCSCPVPKQ